MKRSLLLQQCSHYPSLVGLVGQVATEVTTSQFKLLLLCLFHKSSETNGPMRKGKVQV